MSSRLVYIECCILQNFALIFSIITLVSKFKTLDAYYIVALFYQYKAKIVKKITKVDHGNERYTC